MPNLHQIQLFIFRVNKRFRFMLVYSCLHYLLFKNESFFLFFSFFKVQSFPYFHDKTRSGVVSLCGMDIPNQNMIVNLNILAATIRSFKMLIDYTLDLTPPFSPIPPPKEREDEEIALKFPLVLAWLWPMSSLQTPQAIFFVCTWEQTSFLLTGIC